MPAQTHPVRPWQAFLLGAGVAAAIVLAGSGADPERMTYGDGLIPRYVAAHLDTDPADVDPVVADRGTSLRYGRIGLAGAIWVASLGRPRWMPYAQPVVIVAAAGLASAAASVLLPGTGALGALLPFLAPGFPLSVSGGYAEVLGLAASLAAVALAVRGRWPAAAAVLSVAILARENAVLVLAGLLGWAALRRLRGGLWLLASPIAVLPWYAYVAARYGHVPPLDPYLRQTTDTVGVPFAALARSLAVAASAEALVAVLAHLALAAAVLPLARRSVFGMVAVAAAIPLVAQGPFAWELVGEAARTSVFLQAFALCAFVVWRRPAWAAPGAVRAP